MLEEGLEEPRGGELELKTGGDEFNEDRSAHKKNKNKKTGTDEEKRESQGSPSGSTIIY